MSSRATFGVWSGVGLVIANMVGAGVFLSSGFMAQSMTPGVLLLAWLVGAVLAMAGARAYAEVARLVPQGGGEYRYLSVLLHPSLGYVAGWASLLVGFSAPIAVDGIAAGAFAHSVWPSLEPRVVAAVLVVALTGLHAAGVHLSARVQNVLVGLKVLLVVGFIAVGLVWGTLAWPSWTPPHPADNPVADFAGSLFFIAFAFSGWNAAIYASNEFKDPSRDVPKAMLIGCALVAVLYLALNYIFVANLTPETGSVVFGFDKFTSLADTSASQVTLGQAVMARLLGEGAAKVMSAVMLLLFISAMSAMTLLGPRVYSAIASDGFLPRVLAAKEGKAPVFALLLQAGVALVMLVSHDLREVLGNVGKVLVLFAALTVAGLFVRARAGAQAPGGPVSPIALVCAGLYVLSSGWMLYFAFKMDSIIYLWLGAVSAAALIAYFATAYAKRAAKPSGSPAS